MNYADYPMGSVVLYHCYYEQKELPAHIVGFSLNFAKEVVLILRVPVVTDNNKQHYDEILVHPSNVTLL